MSSSRIAYALALPLALAAPLWSSSPATAAPIDPVDPVAQAGDDDEKTYDYGAKVKIELRMEDGTVVKHRGEMRSFGNEWRFEFEGAEHRHLVTLEAQAEEGDKQLEVTLAYDRDGSAVIAPYKDTYPIRKRQTLWTQDGKLAIALTFIPTKFEREDTSRDDNDKIAPDDDDDPLGGSLFE